MRRKKSSVLLILFFLAALGATSDATSAEMDILARIARETDTCTTKDFFSRPGLKRSVVIIEDAHTHASIQTQIIETIKIIHAHERASNADAQPLLLQEGGRFGTIDTSIHTRLAPAGELETYLEDKLARGQIGAAEYLHTLAGGFTFFGIEDVELYETNYEHFIEIARLRPDIKNVLADFSERFAKLRDLVFTDELKKFYDMINTREDAREDLEDYLDTLRLHALQYEVDLTQYPALTHYFEARRALSALDFERLKTELARYNASATTPVPFSEAHAMAENGLITVQEYPTLFTYGRLHSLLAATQMIAFVKEKERLERVLLARVAYTDEEKELLANLHRFAAIEKLLGFRLSREEAAHYADVLTDEADPAREIIVYLRSYFDPLEVPLPLSDLISRSRAFYDVVEERDRALSENITRAMERHDTPFATVVIGGFHTRGVTKRLKEKGVAFLVLQPTVGTDATIDIETYYDIMQSFWQTRE